MTTDPLTLRLPSWLCDSFDLARAIANEHRAPGRTIGVCRFDRFEMRSHERAFVKTVLARRRNLWLFRTSQRRSCGDFIAIDCSVVDELVAREILEDRSPVELLYGDNAAVLTHLGHR